MKEDSAMPKWPQIFFEVTSIDSWTRCRTEGYGFTAFPYREADKSFGLVYENNCNINENFENQEPKLITSNFS